MAGNYRSRGNNIASKVGNLVRGARSTHERKGTLQKLEESKVRTTNARYEAKAKAGVAIEQAKGKARVGVVVARGEQERKNVTHKANTKKSGSDKKKIAPGKKW